MARRKYTETEYTRFWRQAQARGISRRVIARDLDMTQGRLNDLILGRAKPTLGESSAIYGKRRATRVFYQRGDDAKSFWVGRRKSYAEIIAGDEDVIGDIIKEQYPGKSGEPYIVTRTMAGTPNPGYFYEDEEGRKQYRQTRVWPIGRSLRRALDE